MGIRVHKMMGYGLIDVSEEDVRLNRESPLFDYELGGQDNLDRYFAWLAERDRFDVAKSLEGEPGRRHSTVQECIEWGTVDGGMANVLCIRPLAWNDWYRYDDAIDYAEQTYLQDEQRDSVQVIDYALYPHSSYMDSRTGERVGGGKVDIHFWMNARRGDDRTKALGTLDELARLGGFESHADAEAHCVPLVPDEVRWLAEFAEVFTDPSTVLSLRPMIYTWWA